ncbi:50S ribosomal protein L24 [bacterium CG1_02_42_9]|nr:MAG: 50S ribosomal protein L24 [bacterium CG1_02_42_9]
MKIHSGDEVQIVKGKDAGKKGKVDKVFSQEDKILLPGLNLVKKHQKPQGNKKPGGIIDLAKPIPVANIRLICPKCSQPTKVGFKIEPDGRKYRFCKKCKQVFT